MTADGSSEREIRARLAKAGQALHLETSGEICQKTKIRLFKSNVLSILLYGSESWKMTKTNNYRLEVFQNRCLRKILKIFWPNTISNAELHRRTSTQPITMEIKTTLMSVDWPRLENAADSNSPNCSQMDTR